MGITDKELHLLFPFLGDASAEFQADFKQAVRIEEFSAGMSLVREEDQCNYLPVVMDGGIRVLKLSPSGREITLYRIEPGESCILTAFSILNDRRFPADAVIEFTGRILLIPALAFQRWMNQSQDFREYVFRMLQERLFATLITISEVAFKRTDLRLMQYIYNRTDDLRNELSLTNQQLANELGTAREVVNRILKDLERSRILELSRGTIRILDREEFFHKMEKISDSV